LVNETKTVLDYQVEQEVMHVYQNQSPELTIKDSFHHALQEKIIRRKAGKW
jgi:hypothetical protein